MASKLLRIRSDASAASRAARLAVAAASRAARLAAVAASLAARSAGAAASHAARLSSRCCTLSIHFVRPHRRASASGEPYETDDFRGKDVTEDDVITDEALDERVRIVRRVRIIRQFETIKHSIKTAPMEQSELIEFADGREVQETDPSHASSEP